MIEMEIILNKYPPCFLGETLALVETSSKYEIIRTKSIQLIGCSYFEYSFEIDFGDVRRYVDLHFSNEYKELIAQNQGEVLNEIVNELKNIKYGIYLKIRRLVSTFVNAQSEIKIDIMNLFEACEHFLNLMKNELANISVTFEKGMIVITTEGHGKDDIFIAGSNQSKILKYIKNLEYKIVSIDSSKEFKEKFPEFCF